MINLEQYPIQRESIYTEDDLIKFEELLTSTELAFTFNAVFVEFPPEPIICIQVCYV